MSERYEYVAEKSAVRVTDAFEGDARALHADAFHLTHHETVVLAEYWVGELVKIQVLSEAMQIADRYEWQIGLQCIAQLDRMVEAGLITSTRLKELHRRERQRHGLEHDTVRQEFEAAHNMFTIVYATDDETPAALAFWIDQQENQHVVLREQLNSGPHHIPAGCYAIIREEVVSFYGASPRWTSAVTYERISLFGNGDEIDLRKEMERCCRSWDEAGRFRWESATSDYFPEDFDWSENMDDQAEPRVITTLCDWSAI
jgi:hypothetical protein